MSLKLNEPDPHRVRIQVTGLLPGGKPIPGSSQTIIVFDTTAETVAIVIRDALIAHADDGDKGLPELTEADLAPPPETPAQPQIDEELRAGLLRTAHQSELTDPARPLSSRIRPPADVIARDRERTGLPPETAGHA